MKRRRRAPTGSGQLRARVLAEAGPGAWLPPQRAVPSGKRYQRRPKHRLDR